MGLAVPAAHDVLSGCERDRMAYESCVDKTWIQQKTKSP